MAPVRVPASHDRADFVVEVRPRRESRAGSDAAAQADHLASPDGLSSAQRRPRSGARRASASRAPPGRGARPRRRARSPSGGPPRRRVHPPSRGRACEAGRRSPSRRGGGAVQGPGGGGSRTASSPGPLRARRRGGREGPAAVSVAALRRTDPGSRAAPAAPSLERRAGRARVLTMPYPRTPSAGCRRIARRSSPSPPTGRPQTCRIASGVTADARAETLRVPASGLGSARPNVPAQTATAMAAPTTRRTPRRAAGEKLRSVSLFFHAGCSSRQICAALRVRRMSEHHVERRAEGDDGTRRADAVSLRRRAREPLEGRRAERCEIDSVSVLRGVSPDAFGRRLVVGLKRVEHGRAAPAGGTVRDPRDGSLPGEMPGLLARARPYPERAQDDGASRQIGLANAPRDLVFATPIQCIGGARSRSAVR